MKTETKKLDNCQVELVVQLDADETKAIIKSVENAFVREVSIPGFRKGKVPLEIVRSEFADGIKQETFRKTVEKNLGSAIKAENLAEVSVADIKDVSCSAEGGGFTATVEVEPVFKLPEYKGLKISSNDTKVTEEALNARITALRDAYAKYEDAKAGETVADGDFVQIDYAGTVDGKPVSEIAPEDKIVASGTGFWTKVEEGRFLPEILAAVKGMAIGETKADVKVAFSKEIAPEKLKGATVIYTVTLKNFRRRLLPTDAELAERAKSESFEKLVADTRDAMEKFAIRQESARREDEAVDLLLKKVDFDVPPSQVRNTTDGFLQRFSERAQYSGLNADYFEKNREKIMKDAEEAALRQVRLWYVLKAIAAAEKIEGKPEEIGKKVIDLVLANAK